MIVFLIKCMSHLSVRRGTNPGKCYALSAFTVTTFNKA